MSTTPRTDAIEERNGNVLCGSANLGFARTLERELAEAKAEAAHYMSVAQKATDDLTRLRAELKELSQAYELNRVSIDELDADRARAERAEAALAKWSVLNLWGGTPEIIHEFIKGQQNRIHHCQDLEAECLEQARLLGMSGEREAALLSALKLMVSKFDAFIDSEYCGTDLLAEQLAQADFARKVIMGEARK